MTLHLKIITIAIILSILLSCNNGILVDKTIIGASEDIVLKKYGNPQRESVIKLGKDVKLHEYQSNLYSLYPNLQQSDTIKLRELFWELQQGKKMVIWLDNKQGNWTVIDNVKWSQEIQF